MRKGVCFLTELGRKGGIELSIAVTEYQHPKGGRIPRGLIVSEPLGHGHSFHGPVLGHVVEKTSSPHSAQETERDRKGIEIKQTLPGHGPRGHFPPKALSLNVSTVFQ